MAAPVAVPGCSSFPKPALDLPQASAVVVVGRFDWGLAKGTVAAQWVDREPSVVADWPDGLRDWADCSAQVAPTRAIAKRDRAEGCLVGSEHCEAELNVKELVARAEEREPQAFAGPLAFVALVAPVLTLRKTAALHPPR